MRLFFCVDDSGLDMDRNTAKYHSCSMAMLGILAIIIMSMCPIRLIMALPGGRETIPDAQSNKELQKLANFAVTQYSSQKVQKP